jgi:hypothetical protein
MDIDIAMPDIRCDMKSIFLGFGEYLFFNPVKQ